MCGDERGGQWGERILARTWCVSRTMGGDDGRRGFWLESGVSHQRWEVTSEVTRGKGILARIWCVTITMGGAEGRGDVGSNLVCLENDER